MQDRIEWLCTSGEGAKTAAERVSAEFRARVSQPEPSADFVEELRRAFDAATNGFPSPRATEDGIRAVLSVLASCGADALPMPEPDELEDAYCSWASRVPYGHGKDDADAAGRKGVAVYVRSCLAPIFAAKDAELERMRDEIFEGAQREDTLTKERNELRGLYRMAVKALDAATKEAEVLRAKVAELEAAVAAAESGKCPTCGATLTVREGGGALVKTCPTHGFVMRGCKVIDD